MDSGCCGIILHNSTILVSIGLCQQNNNKKQDSTSIFEALFCESTAAQYGLIKMAKMRLWHF